MRLVFLTFFLLFAIVTATPALAATGCDLNDPDRDVARFFPEATGYKVVAVSIRRLGGDRLMARIETKLRDKLQGLYEAIDMPYTIYVIFKNDQKIGYIHGVDQKGRYGTIQIFLAMDPQERITAFYIQKMSGPHAGKMREPEFTRQFEGLTIDDFNGYEVPTGKAKGKVAEIANTVFEAEYDFQRLLRGTKKNLVLTNEFIQISPEVASGRGSAMRKLTGEKSAKRATAR